MSFDLLLKTDCSHYIYDEYYDILDRKRIYIKRPVLNVDSFKVKVNDFIVTRDDERFGYYLRLLNNDDLYYVEFKKRVESDQYWVELSYLTSKEMCPRCIGSKKEYDPKISIDGKFYTVKDEEKLSQEVEKWLLTELGSHKYRPRIGTEIVLMLGQKGIPGIDLILKEQIIDILEIIRACQQNQKSIQDVSEREQLGDIKNIDIREDDIDPRVLILEVSFTTASGAEQQVGAKFRTGFTGRL